MEGSRRRRNTTVPLQREFMGSRLEQQILIRAFDLVLPPQRPERVPDEHSTTETGRPPVEPRRSQGA